MSHYQRGYQWAIAKHIATTDGDTELLAAPADAGVSIFVQGLIICITTKAAQAFDIEDDAAASPVELFKAPASLELGSWTVDCGPLGVKLTTGAALQFDTAAAGVGATISAFGYYG